MQSLYYLQSDPLHNYFLKVSFDLHEKKEETHIFSNSENSPGCLRMWNTFKYDTVKL